MSPRKSNAPAGAVLTIDVAALASNYRKLAKQSGKAACGAAIKGEAYGLGLGPVAKTLWREGCRHYFVARPQEGADLRQVLPKADIYVLDGLYDGAAPYYLKHNLRPALVSAEEMKAWSQAGRGHPCAIHVDTGINRAGIPLRNLAAHEKILRTLNISLLMSHLACSDEPGHAMNHQQLAQFNAARKLLPGVPVSLANSGGVFLGKDFAFNITRPGIALYGANPTPHTKNPMKPVASLKLRVLQVKTIAKGETVGYSATWAAPRETRIAIVAAGYRDGLPRKLSSSPQGGPAQMWVGGRRCPIVGRVSMDMTVLDVTEAKRVRAGDFAEVFGPHISVDEVAGWADTISYEVLTHLGNRYARVYKGEES
jgi:alanine racemase